MRAREIMKSMPNTNENDENVFEGTFTFRVFNNAQCELTLFKVDRIIAEKNVSIQKSKISGNKTSKFYFVKWVSSLK
jgi:hypothetical protein